MQDAIASKSRRVHAHSVAIDARSPAVAAALLDVLEARSLIEASARERAARVQRETRQRIDVVLTELGLVPAETLQTIVAEFLGMPLLAEAELPTAPVMEDVLVTDHLRRNGLLPIGMAGDTLVLATSDPFATDAVAAISFQIERPVELRLAPARMIEQTFQRLYPDIEPVGSETAGGDRAFVDDDDLQRLRDAGSEAPVIRLVNRLITGAVTAHASDIHIEPEVDAVRVRYRIDGVMAEVERLLPETQAGIASRIKILARLNIAERRLPQDGRIKFVASGREVDLRISTAPTLYGESVVLRLLDTADVDLDLSALGFDDAATATLTQLLASPNGIILVTGPTGSGKTTTLYSGLRLLNSVERKVFTIEDPIEYQMAGINQIQIKPGIGLDFVHCLRAILRQDPDVVMIGEMRDVETARTAIRAALTGHLVLSTVHTNSAAASITRLLDMGVEDYLLASSLNGVLAQRLVRRLCLECAEPLPPESPAYGRLKTAAERAGLTLSSARPRRPIGCTACRHTGFRGRTTVAEILVVDDDLRRLMKVGTTDREIEASAINKGMTSLYRNGLAKVLAGSTTLEEILRVTQR